MKKNLKLLALLLALVLAVAMTACGSKEESSEEPLSDATQTEEQAETEVATDDYDIAANIRLAGGGDEKAVDTDHFTLTLTHGDTWDYEIDSKTSITFYNIAGREAGCGGRLLTLIAYEPGDTTYEEMPHYCVVGEKDGKVYVAEFPSDVQADVENEQNMNDYMEVYSEVNKIEEGAEDSPLVLK